MHRAHEHAHACTKRVVDAFHSYRIESLVLGVSRECVICEFLNLLFTHLNGAHANVAAAGAMAVSEMVQGSRTCVNGFQVCFKWPHAIRKFKFKCN